MGFLATVVPRGRRRFASDSLFSSRKSGDDRTRFHRVGDFVLPQACRPPWRMALKWLGSRLTMRSLQNPFQRSLVVVALVLGACVGSAGTSPVPEPKQRGPASGPYVRALVERGSFKLPPHPTFEYAGKGLAFNPARRSLYITGWDGVAPWTPATAEVSIPALGGTASFLQDFVDPLEGALTMINPSASTQKYITGYAVVGDELIVAGVDGYDADGMQRSSHFARPLSLSVRGRVRGPFQVGALGGRFYGGYMGAVAEEWRSAFKGPWLTGQCCLSIIGTTSYGPALFAFDPARLQTPAAVPLVYYPADNPLVPYGAAGAHPLFSGVTRVTGVAQIPGTASVLFFGTTGTGASCYGPGTADPSQAGQSARDIGDTIDRYCFDPADKSKGDHAYPYASFVWAYDANDLAAVAGRRKSPWQPRPYATMTILTGNPILGAALDPASRLIYVTEAFGDGLRPVIHVYSPE